MRVGGWAWLDPARGGCVHPIWLAVAIVGIVAQSDMVLLLRTVATVMFKMGLVAELPTDLHVENIASDMYGCTMCGFALRWARRRWLVRWGQ